MKSVSSRINACDFNIGHCSVHCPVQIHFHLAVLHHHVIWPVSVIEGKASSNHPSAEDQVSIDSFITLSLSLTTSLLMDLLVVNGHLLLEYHRSEQGQDPLTSPAHFF